MNTSRRQLLKGLVAAPLLAAATVEAQAPNQTSEKTDSKFFPPGCLIVVVGGAKTGKTFFMRELLSQVLDQKKTVVWINAVDEFKDQKTDVVFLDVSRYLPTARMLEGLKSFAVRNQCCVVISVQNKRKAMTIHDEIQVELPTEQMIFPDVVVWLQRPVFITSDLKFAVQPVVVKNRLGDLKNPPFRVYDTMLFTASEVLL